MSEESSESAESSAGESSHVVAPGASITVNEMADILASKKESTESGSEEEDSRDAQGEDLGEDEGENKSDEEETELSSEGSEDEEESDSESEPSASKIVRARVGDDDVELTEDTEIEWTINGKKTLIKIKDLATDFSGRNRQKELDDTKRDAKRTLQEAETLKVQTTKERDSLNNQLQEFVKDMGEGKVEAALNKALLMTGQEPEQFWNDFYSKIPDIEDSQKRSLVHEQVNEYYREEKARGKKQDTQKNEESRLTNLAVEQMESRGLSEKDLEVGYSAIQELGKRNQLPKEDLEVLQSGSPDDRLKLVVDYSQQIVATNLVKAAAAKVDSELLQDTDKFSSLVKLAIQETPSEEELVEAIQLAYGSEANKQEAKADEAVKTLNARKKTSSKAKPSSASKTGSKPAKDYSKMTIYDL